MSESKALSALEAAFDFRDEAPELCGELFRAAPWLARACEDWRRALPLPATSRAFVEPPWYRPPGSHRCVYYCPASLDRNALPTTPRGCAVAALKGLEPALPELTDMFRGFDRPCYSPHNILEHLVFEEKKVPGCLTVDEALREALAARMIQRAHLRHYGSLARLPFPLFVFRHRPETNTRIREQLQSFLSEAAFHALRPSLEAGLAVYVYYYPTPPVRVRDIESTLEGLSFQRRSLKLLTLCDPERVIERWVQGVTRMLYLGVLPASLASLHTGSCCQPQNACLDGGFVDLDSLTPLDSLPSPTAVDAALEFSMSCMRDSVRALVMGSLDPTRPEGGHGRFDLHYLTRYLERVFERALHTESAPGLSLDPRIQRYFAGPSELADLVDVLGTYYSRTDGAFAERCVDFAPFGNWLMSATRS